LSYVKSEVQYLFCSWKPYFGHILFPLPHKIFHIQQFMVCYGKTKIITDLQMNERIRKHNNVKFPYYWKKPFLFPFFSLKLIENLFDDKEKLILFLCCCNGNHQSIDWDKISIYCLLFGDVKRKKCVNTFIDYSHQDILISSWYKRSVIAIRTFYIFFLQRQ
jgi:hypothetical protein